MDLEKPFSDVKSEQQDQVVEDNAKKEMKQGGIRTMPFILGMFKVVSSNYFYFPLIKFNSPKLFHNFFQIWFYLVVGCERECLHS